MNASFVLPAETLTTLVQDAGRRTEALIADLSDEQLMGPLLPTVNPMRWEVGHVAYFYEAMLLRVLGRKAPLLAGNDTLYDSFVVAHDDRWSLPMPDRAGTLAYLSRVRELVCERLQAECGPQETYLTLLGVFHEDMHDEALLWARQTHGFPLPPWHTPAPPVDGHAGPLPGDVSVPGGTYFLGAPYETPYVFDNEKWAHPVTLAPFRIARAPVTQAEFAAFVDAGGYAQEALWGYQGWLWRRRNAVEHPLYWRRGADGWERRHFDRWLPLSPHAPMIHVNWYEAQAFCAWAGRRLPSEAEWEAAASAAPDSGVGPGPRKRTYPWGEAPPAAAHANLDGAAGDVVDVAACPAGDSAAGCRQLLGNVWEWTETPFYPFPGYEVDTPYREYSAPWFGYNKVLRGGAWMTRSRLLRNSFRNFFLPQRNDVFAGFRTCAR